MTVIENLLKKSDYKIVLHLTQRQASVIVTALQLIRFEIITKAEYKQVKPTTDLMKDLIIILESKIKVQDLR